MNKKVIGIIIVLVVIVIAIVIGIFFKLNHKCNNNISYEIIGEGYFNYKNNIISNYQEYREFVDYIDSQSKVYNFDSDKYNEEYFKDKSIAIINIITGSGMNKISNIDISTTGNLLVCKVDIDYPRGMSTGDVNGELLLIEIDKYVKKIKIEQ